MGTACAVVVLGAIWVVPLIFTICEAVRDRRLRKRFEEEVNRDRPE